LDIYPFNSDYAILEIEVNDINEEIKLPPFTIVKEVTADERFKNHSLAKTLQFDLS
jgi:CYTH domain-containing protein